MKKTKKIYGVSGMMEYQAIVKIGKATMKVQFSDGSMTAMGVNPATFTTEDFITQHAIEHSADFKRGRIFIHKIIDLDEDVEIAHNRPTPPIISSAASKNSEKIKSDSQSDETEINTEPDAEIREIAKDAAGPLTQVEFSNNDDAKDYLETTFGVIRSKLRNRDIIRAIGEANGVEIIFVNNE